MVDPRIRLKNRFLAVILAWMVPGAGHLYQGRKLKSAIYFCSITGLWIMAMHLSEWKVMAAPFNERNERSPLIEILKFGAQSGVGLPAAGSVVQRERLKGNPDKPQDQLDGPLESEAVGHVIYSEEVGGIASGVVHLEPASGRFGPTIGGTFTGKFENGQPIEFELTEAKLGAPIDGDQRRLIEADIVSNDENVGKFLGTLPIATPNWLFVPLNEPQQMELHDRLGKLHELATLLSVVAGLLNILAVFDAFGGPAYGYGDEESVPGPESATGPRKTKEPPAMQPKPTEEEPGAALEEAKQQLKHAADAKARAIADEQRAQQGLVKTDRDRQQAEQTLKSARAEHEEAAYRVKEAQQALDRSRAVLHETQQRVELAELQIESVRDAIAKQPDNAALALELESRQRTFADEKQILAANQQAAQSAQSALEQTQSKEQTTAARVHTAQNNFTAASNRAAAALREVSELAHTRELAEDAEREAERELQRLTEQATRPVHEPAQAAVLS